MCLHGFTAFASATFGVLKFLSLNRLEEEAFPYLLVKNIFCILLSDSVPQNIEDVFPCSLSHILCFCSFEDRATFHL